MTVARFVTACALSSVALTARLSGCPEFHGSIDGSSRPVEPESAGDCSDARRPAGHDPSHSQLRHPARGDL